MGFTRFNMIYLREGIGSAFASVERTVLIGHELFHSWRLARGVSLFKFAARHLQFGSGRLNPLERAAYEFGDTILVCRRNETC